MDNILIFGMNSRRTRCIISLSALKALRNLNLDNHLILQIVNKLDILSHSGKYIVLCWILSHVRIAWNEEADAAAKHALSLPVVKCTLPFSEFKHRINSFIERQWQMEWTTQVNNKLHSINMLGDWYPAIIFFRRDETVLARLRIGNTRYTYALF